MVHLASTYVALGLLVLQLATLSPSLLVEASNHLPLGRRQRLKAEGKLPDPYIAPPPKRESTFKNLRDACREDARRLCPDLAEDVGVCLRSRLSSEIDSDECKEWVKADFACLSDVRGNGCFQDITYCLLTTQPEKLSAKCRESDYYDVTTHKRSSTIIGEPYFEKRK
jgi:hypothetical protein